MKHTVGCLVCCVFVSLSLYGQNLRQVSHPEGLTNGSVLDVCSDSDGILWVGTCEGLYSFYAQRVHPVHFLGGQSLEGQLIEQIVSTGDDVMWVRSGYGLKRWSKKRGELEDFPSFKGNYRIAAGGSGTLLVRDKDRQIYRWDEKTDCFSELRLPMEVHTITSGFGDTDAYLWLCGSDGIYRFPWVKDENGIRPGSAECIFPHPVTQCISGNGMVHVVSREGMLYHVDIDAGLSAPIMDISDEIRHRGHLTGVVEMRGNLYLSFISSGIIKYHRSNGYWEGEDIGLKVGVFRIRKDALQDILWIASDGQGLFQYWDSDYSVRQFFSSDIHPQVGQPVRALFKDASGNLWVGTKGSGLLKMEPSGKTRLYMAGDSPLPDNSIFAFSDSGLDGFWVGCEEGIAFYDRRSEKLLPVEQSEDIQYVHAIREVGDTLLQLATVGTGVVEASVSRSGGHIRLRNIRRYTVDDGAFSSNYFFSMYAGGDGTLWLGNRGLGLFSLENGRLEPCPLSTADSLQTVSDVFAVTEAGGRVWVGTGNGLVGRASDGTEIYLSRSSGLPNNTVHALLPDPDGGLWLSTNEGLARYVPSGGIVRYGHEKGLSVIEFSDGAAFSSGDVLYFGGVNGWVEVSRNAHYTGESAFVPKIMFTFLRSGNEEHNLYVSLRQNRNEVELPAGENTFTIDFLLNDLIHDADYDFSYRLNGGREGDWIPLGQVPRLIFSRLSPGKYQLEVRALNRMTGNQVLSDPVIIRMKAPWYMTPFMKALYCLLALLLVAAGVLFAINRTRRREKDAIDALERQHKEELYEEKLMFFTNITHEFKTPLTLIYTPCEQILSYKGTDSYIRKYALQIRNNAERLGTLIQEVIDYRRLETKHQAVRLQAVNLSGLCHEAAAGFAELAGNNGIFLEENIEEGILWNTDRKCFFRIESNLITNALKYTKEGGTVRVSLQRDNRGGVLLKVFNTGKGIREEDRPTIFDRFRVLDGVEETRVSSITGRNGLGLSICKSTVELLGGTISVDSKVGEWAEFTVWLPELPLPEEAEEPDRQEDTLTDILPERTPAAEENGARADRKGLPVLLVVDDNPDLLTLLEDSLDTFDVRPATDAESAMAVLRKEHPVLVITDIMMPGTDGYEFTRQIKQNKHTMHIPVIILSARNAVEDRVKGMELGADAYLGKPFSLTELRAVITQLLGKGDLLKEYYNTSASAFDYVDGKLMSTEDRDFLSAVDAFMEKKLSSGEVTVESMAESFHLSTRNLYRRFKALGLLPPNEFIRERKLTTAAKLLCTTNMTIQEIIYECGFNNRAHFYKEFGKRFGCTPREYRSGHRTKDEDLT